MAEYIKATRPDGTVVQVSRKLFTSTYQGLGYTEGESVKETDTYEAKGERKTTRPKSKRKSTLTADVVANGPSEKAK